MPEPTKEKPIPEKREDAPKDKANYTKDSDKPIPFPGPDVGPGSDSASKSTGKP